MREREEKRVISADTAFAKCTCHFERLVESNFLGDGGTAQRAVVEARFTFPARANVATREKDDVALQYNMLGSNISST